MGEKYDAGFRKLEEIVGTETAGAALKAFDDLELDALTDRSKLEDQMNKAKARFEELRSKFKKAA